MRKATAAVVIGLVLVAAAIPAHASGVVSASDTSLSWTGKQGTQANYRWSAMVSSTDRRDQTVQVTLQLLDASGGVVGSDSQKVTVPAGGQVSAGGDASLAYSSASRAVRYRVAIEGVDG